MYCHSSNQNSFLEVLLLLKENILIYHNLDVSDSFSFKPLQIFRVLKGQFGFVILEFYLSRKDEIEYEVFMIHSTHFGSSMTEYFGPAEPEANRSS
jgi:hypothetical protein